MLTQQEAFQDQRWYCPKCYARRKKIPFLRTTLDYELNKHIRMKCRNCKGRHTTRTNTASARLKTNLEKIVHQSQFNSFFSIKDILKVVKDLDLNVVGFVTDKQRTLLLGYKRSLVSYHISYARYTGYNRSVKCLLL